MRVELNVYSGRPNPGWELSKAQQTELDARLGALTPMPEPIPEPDGLGYRGLTVADLTIGGGVVRRRRPDGRTQQWADADRSLERWLIGTGQGQVDDALWHWALGEIGPR